MEEKITKKQIIALVIGVLTLVVLVLGSTYAYFSVTSTRNAGTTTITGDIGGDTLGTVTLSGGNTNLYLGVSAYDMSLTNKGTTYYSSTTAGSRETNLANAGKATYTAALSGDDALKYACDYEFTVTSTGSMIGQTSFKDLLMVFEGDIEKSINLTGTDTVSGTWYGINASDATRTFNTYIQLTNTEDVQNDIAGTDLSIEITNTNWNCYLSETEELKGDAYALVVDEGIKESCVLIFTRSETPITTSDTYDGNTIEAVFTGIEETEFDASNAWGNAISEMRCYFVDVIFEEKIRPLSTKSWFDASVGVNSNGLDLTKLDTSNVTDMSSMFEMKSLDQITGLENLNTSNVTNMSAMFRGATINKELDLSGWDTSNVTNMSNMFYAAAINSDLDLTGWDVKKVTDYTNFATNIYGSGKLTQPSWPTT